MLRCQAAERKARDAETNLKSFRTESELTQKQLTEQLTRLQQQALDLQQQLQVSVTEKQLQVKQRSTAGHSVSGVSSS